MRTEVDEYIGIDYSLIDDPVVTSKSLDMNFRVRLKPIKCDLLAHSLTVTNFVASAGDVF